ncbi:MAG: putA, partial [Polaromonas sp.]|nr:putA [Polaromonas sp.]
SPPPFWAMERLLQEYPISSAEGLALMRLAEALLRVPDIDTAIALTADQLGRADFDSAGDGAMARLSGAAIGLSKKFLPEGEGGGSAGVLGRVGARTVVAAALRAVQLLGHQFVLGQTMPAALGEAAAARRRLPGLRFSYDMLGEGARTADDARHYLASYQSAIDSIAARARPDGATEQNDGISIKLSALHPRYEDGQRGRVMAELVPRVWALCQHTAAANISLTLDAEEADRLELSLAVFDALAALTAQHLPGWRGLGLALQAYQSRSLDLVRHVIALARTHRLRLMCRLVKGAYWDFEIKRAQEMGLPHYPVFTHKHHTDLSYLACARELLAAPDAVYPQFAGHNAGTIAAVLQMAAAAGAPFELQRLHGMGEGLYREVLRNPQIACRVYAPVGSHRDLLAYLVRRLLENGANSSFVHQLADGSVGLDDLLASPLWRAPLPSLPLPADLYGPSRQNSRGLDLTVESMRAPLRAAWAATAVPSIPDFDATLAAEALSTGAPAIKSGAGGPSASAPRCCAGPPTRWKTSCRCSLRCS